MALNTGSVGSIDFHTHVQISDSGHTSLDGAPMEASSKNFRARESRQPVTETADHNRFLNAFTGPVHWIEAFDRLEIKPGARNKISTGNAARLLGLTQP
ncbi:MAG: hypothetical protein M0Z39_11490 [Actinomycetota bacterium]|jgi:hypothetical protein|nr:hypothetical protein [Actinomycetota bacterium]